MKFQIADIVRFKPEEEEFGLYEVTGYSADEEITITNNECNSECFADENALILVCSVQDRKDITS
jgi:hypothetical protein